MPEFEVVTFIIAIASFIGVLIGPALGGWVRLQELRHEAKQQSASERLKRLQDTQAALIENMASVTALPEIRIIGLIVSIPDKQLQDIAANGDNAREKARQAVIRLGHLIDNEMRD